MPKTYFKLDSVNFVTDLNLETVKKDMLKIAEEADSKNIKVDTWLLANELAKKNGYSLTPVDTNHSFCVYNYNKMIRCGTLDVHMFFGQKDVVNKVVRFNYPGHTNEYGWLASTKKQTRLVKVLKQNSLYLEGEDLMEKGSYKKFCLSKISDMEVVD